MTMFIGLSIFVFSLKRLLEEMPVRKKLSELKANYLDFRLTLLNIVMDFETC